MLLWYVWFVRNQRTRPILLSFGYPLVIYVFDSSKEQDIHGTCY